MPNFIAFIDSPEVLESVIFPQWCQHCGGNARNFFIRLSNLAGYDKDMSWIRGIKVQESVQAVIENSVLSFLYVIDSRPAVRLSRNKVNCFSNE